MLALQAGLVYQVLLGQGPFGICHNSQKEKSSPVNSVRVNNMPQQELSFKDWATNFLLGGVSGAVSKTFTAPIERVKCLI